MNELTASVASWPASKLAKLSPEEYRETELFLLQCLAETDRANREPWERWLLELFPTYFQDASGALIPFAAFHRDLWQWVRSLKRGARPEAFCGFWSRDSGKSTNAEMACVYAAGEEVRRYAIYLSETQSQADDHVQNVAALMESGTVSRKYPRVGQRLLSKYGQSRGWRINRLRCANGFTLDAIGLDRAVRGARLEESRPDLIVCDDVDGMLDTPRATAKKLQKIQRDILPAGSDDLAVLFVQNLVGPHSIASRLATGTADFLQNRQMSGPHRAIEGLTFEQDGARTVLTGGTPTWAGFDLARAQAAVDDYGFRSFLVEHQQETREAEGMFLGGIWRESVHVLASLAIPPFGTIARSFDRGLEKPSAGIWWAESNGTPYRPRDGRVVEVPRGSLFAIAEHYGCTGRPNQGVRRGPDVVGADLLAFEGRAAWGERAEVGPADPSIYSSQDGLHTIAAQMEAVGVRWHKGDNSPGSRAAAGARILTMLDAALKGATDRPHLYFFESCRHIARTFPELPKDPTRADDVDTDAEDHLWDATKQRVLRRRVEASADFGHGQGAMM